jgi:hypothetical protein
MPSASLANLQAQHGPRYRWLLLLSVMIGTMASDHVVQSDPSMWRFPT